MGTYLVTGIVQNICIRKKDIKAELPIETVQTALQQEVNLDYYTYSEDDSRLYWTLKPHILEGNLPEFLESQFKMYDEQNKNWREDLEQIIQAQTGKRRLDLASEKSLKRFQLLESNYDYLKVIKKNGFDEHVMLGYDLIAFFVDGKIVMECYGKILRYFTKNIRLQNQQYPIANCLKIMITS